MHFFVKREFCPVCEGTSFVDLYFKPYSDNIISSYLEQFYGSQGYIELNYLKEASYSLKQCRHCKLVFQEFIPNAFLTKKLYEEWIDPVIAKKEVCGHPLSYYLRHANEISMLIRYFGVPPSRLTFLDFGMGWCEWLLVARGFGCVTYGMELSLERIAHAKQLGIEVLDWDDVPACKVDYINTEQVFEHLPDPLGTLKHLSKGLKEGGLLKISVPNGNRFAKRSQRIDWDAPKFSTNSPNVVAPLEHINCFSTRTLVLLAERCNLVPVRLMFDNLTDLSVKEVAKTVMRPIFDRVINGGSTTIFLKKNKSSLGVSRLIANGNC